MVVSTHLKKYESNWIISPRIGVKIKQCLSCHHLKTALDFTTTTTTLQNPPTLPPLHQTPHLVSSLMGEESTLIATKSSSNLEEPGTYSSTSKTHRVGTLKRSPGDSNNSVTLQKSLSLEVTIPIFDWVRVTFWLTHRPKKVAKIELQSGGGFLCFGTCFQMSSSFLHPMDCHAFLRSNWTDLAHESGLVGVGGTWSKLQMRKHVFKKGGLPKNTTGTNFSVVAGRSYKHIMTHDFCLWLADVSIQSPLLGGSSHDL